MRWRTNDRVRKTQTEVVITALETPLVDGTGKGRTMVSPALTTLVWPY